MSSPAVSIQAIKNCIQGCIIQILERGKRFHVLCVCSSIADIYFSALACYSKWKSRIKTSDVWKSEVQKYVQYEQKMWLLHITTTANIGFVD